MPAIPRGVPPPLSCAQVLRVCECVRVTCTLSHFPSAASHRTLILLRTTALHSSKSSKPLKVHEKIQWFLSENVACCHETMF